MHRQVFGDPQPVRPLTPRVGASRLSDAEVLERARNARNGAEFERLFAGDLGIYSSRSEADLALVSRLLFWTSGDAHQADALFRQSGLMRSKWDRKSGAGTYGQRTITYALRSASDLYKPRPTAAYTVRVEVA